MVWDSMPSGRDAWRYAVMAQDERFLVAKVRYRRLALGTAVAFLGWYLAYVALSAFARGFMARQVVGNVNVALVLGVLQFASTFVLAWWYSHYSRRSIDPLTAQLREEAARAGQARLTAGGQRGHRRRQGQQDQQGRQDQQGQRGRHAVVEPRRGKHAKDTRRDGRRDGRQDGMRRPGFGGL
ncbi:DUF485 domain-containing protein [Actinomadura barringtoniae]|uniref:DUF485 domain-containing protein n=1 Tax=Actinomadura barringtoniae TaxID=1427535 RepID=A0A939PKU8_9ACTN|nr:DUF485 domain-containing protein [Actinomadura barringtoniae]MBO2454797.1 DUF485 domain-containing protein [Actinomadura barringtoniae]